MEQVLAHKELLGFLAAVIGLVSAWINRKKIVEVRSTHTYTVESAASSSQEGPPAGGSVLGRRIKRFFLCGGLAFVGLIALGMCVENQQEDVASVLAWPIMILLVFAAYHLTAIAMILAWRVMRVLG